MQWSELTHHHQTFAQSAGRGEFARARVHAQHGSIDRRLHFTLRKIGLQHANIRISNLGLRHGHGQVLGIRALHQLG